MIPEFLAAMGLMFNVSTGLFEANDDPTAEARPDWSVLVPDNHRNDVKMMLKVEDFPDLDEWGAVDRYVQSDTITILILDLGNPETNVTDVFVATYSPVGRMKDLIKVGNRGNDSVTPFLDVRDNHGESMAFIARERPVKLTFEDSPEGTVVLRTVEITEVDVWDAEHSDTETYRLTELHRSYVFDPDGRIRLTESRPVPTDADRFRHRFNVNLEGSF